MIAHGRRGFLGQRDHLFVVTKYYKQLAMPTPYGTRRPKRGFGTVGSRPHEASSRWRQGAGARPRRSRGPIGATAARTSGNGASRVSFRHDPANKHVAYTCEASYHRGAWQ